ncbi:MAG: hypothetical protein ACREID_07080, partial [Planctomycetota bacterium]
MADPALGPDEDIEGMHAGRGPAATVTAIATRARMVLTTGRTGASADCGIPVSGGRPPPAPGRPVAFA